MLIVGNENAHLMHMKEVTDYVYLMWERYTFRVKVSLT